MRARSRILPAAALVAALGAAPAAAEPASLKREPAPTETSCYICHEELDGAALEPVRLAGEDVHFARALSCHDCHGGDPTAGFDGDPFAAHDVTKGFRGKPSRLHVPELCGGCHADAAFIKKFDPKARVDQLAEYRTSLHGRRAAAGDQAVAVCVDCHGAHGVHEVADPRSSAHPARVADTCARCHADAGLMRAYRRRADLGEEYGRSVHAKALYEKGDTSAPTCNDCHGNHGAVPPGVDSVANVCGSCHGREATLFREVEAKKGLDLAACIQCVICHGSHAVLPPRPEMLGVGPESTCTGCHAEGDAGFAAADRMSRELGRLRERLAAAEKTLDEAERAGMEVGADRSALQAATDSLVESRVLVHGFDLERFLAASSAGVTAAEAGVAAGERAFAELWFRRLGLGLSLIVIGAVVAALALTIRRLER